MFKYLYTIYHIESQQGKKEFDMTTISPVLEDYLEVVLRFQREKHFARVSDISKAMEVGKSAVTAALKSLSGKGLVNYQP